MQTKTTFVKSSGKSYCEKCKKVGHALKNSNGNVSAKFVGIPIDGAKKNAIWVPKVLVTNVQGHKKVWVAKRVTSLL